MTLNLPDGARLRAVEFTHDQTRFSVHVFDGFCAVYMHTPDGACKSLDTEREARTLDDGLKLCVREISQTRLDSEGRGDDHRYEEAAGAGRIRCRRGCQERQPAALGGRRIPHRHQRRPRPDARAYA